MYLAWDSQKYGVTKKVIIATTSRLGHSNVLGWFLIAGAIFNGILIVLILICQCTRGSKLGVEVEKLSWD